jgi:hypothetical protein
MSESNTNIVNGTPPCQNIMFPNPYQFFPSSSHPLQHPYHYQPLVHVPTRTSLVTLGEMGASVDMLRAQLTELSRRMESMESKVSQFEKLVSNDIILLKNTLSDHSTELLNVRDVAENAYDDANKMNDLVVEQNYCIDEMADAISRTIHLCRKQLQVQKKVSFESSVSSAQLGIIRRRVSKIEEFTNDFFEQFESFKSVKDIITGLSDHINECDRDISFIVTTKYNKENKDSSGGDEDDEGDIIQPIQCSTTPCIHTLGNGFLNDYFSKYDDVDDNVGVGVGVGDGVGVDDDVNENNSEINNDDDFEKLF